MHSAKLAAAFTLNGVLATFALLLACEWVLLNGLFDAVPRGGPPPTLSALAARLPDALRIAVLLGAPAGLLASAALNFYVRRYGAIDIALGGGICAQAAALINVVTFLLMRPTGPMAGVGIAVAIFAAIPFAISAMLTARLTRRWQIADDFASNASHADED